MRVDKITFQQTFPTGQFQNQKLGMEILLDYGDDIDKVFEMAKKLVADAFVSINPPSADWNTQTGVLTLHEPVIPSMDYKERDRLEQLIEKADSVEVLAAYKEAASQHGAIKTYMDKLKKLTQ